MSCGVHRWSNLFNIGAGTAPPGANYTSIYIYIYIRIIIIIIIIIIYVGAGTAPAGANYTSTGNLIALCVPIGYKERPILPLRPPCSG